MSSSDLGTTKEKTSQIRQSHAKNDLQRFGSEVILFREFLFFSTLGWNYNSSQNGLHPESGLDLNINQTAQSALNHAHDEVVLWFEFGGLDLKNYHSCVNEVRD